MPNFEKMSIYIPHYIKLKLDEDAKQFEIFKANGIEINLNAFLGNLILGFYDQFYLECQRNVQRVEEVLRKNIRRATMDNISEVSKEILRAMSIEQKAYSSRKEVKISLKPTLKTAGFIQDIKKSNKDDSISNTFSRLFTSYLNRPTYIREQIIHKETYDALHDAIQSNHPISFSTHQNPDLVHTVFPYKVAWGREELFNYLLCAEFNSDGVLQAKSYRLSRINGCRKSRAEIVLDESVIERLEKMIEYGPAFEINDEELCTVFLTEQGHRSYQQIYFQRPEADSIEQLSDGYLYSFHCSKEHIKRYFRRFDAGQSRIVKPEWLKNEVVEEYKRIIGSYQNEGN